MRGTGAKEFLPGTFTAVCGFGRDEMKERPILFTAPMVRAILAGKKTQTRRVVKSPYGIHEAEDPGTIPAFCPYGIPPDLLWIREGFFITEEWNRHHGPQKIKRAEEIDKEGENVKWIRAAPSIYMPRWACRIILEIKSVRIERLQDISEKDAVAEGITGPHQVGYPAYHLPGDSKPRYSRAAAAYEILWDSINEKRGLGWKRNPWVWVLTFDRVPENTKANHEAMMETLSDLPARDKAFLGVK
jgi:hypothetical protein